jgi:glycosyltransferase involved in cell wall biosynthesis
LCTSENEGTPISLIEAQLLGKPVISTDVGSVGEVTISERAGYVLNYGVMEFSTKIIELAQDSNRYQEFSETARIFASKNFTLDSFIRNHLDLYEEILTI